MPDHVSGLSWRRDGKRRFTRGGSLAVRLLCIGMTVLSTSSLGGTEPVITRIEEDWVLVVRTPNVAKTAPQLLNVISPVANVSSVHAILEINHSTQPEFTAGGLQLQGWNGDTLTGFHHGSPAGALRFDNEIIRYTLRMEIGDDKLTVEVVNGRSDSWGAFGGKGILKTHMKCDVNDLSRYSPQFSADRSRVGYGGRRVDRFYLDRTRYFSDAKLIRQDDTDRRSPSDPKE